MSLSVDIEHVLGGFRLAARFESDGRLVALFGRSGAGKTSVVHVIAGLIRPERGRVVVDGRMLTDTASGIHLAPHRRRVGYIFQDSRLFPHLSVRGNLLYGRWFTPRGERRIAFDDVVDLLGIRPLLERRIAGLSGGERQRVAIGRALLASPRLLLMDEPLAALDGARKAEILPYIERLRDETRVPIVYVSHSVAEVTRLATSMVVMSEGRVAAAGPTAEIMGRLDLFPLTGRAEAGAVLDCVVAGHESADGLTVLRSPAGELRIPRLDAAAGAPVRVRIRARDVVIARERPVAISTLNMLDGTVAAIGAPDGPVVDIQIDCGGARLLARVTRKSAGALGLAVGLPVCALVKSVAFDRHSVGGGLPPWDAADA
ncbi:MAG: molybdenum ABC transporter ATP-binding protein [Alphaproteobacteria bacterium]